MEGLGRGGDDEGERGLQREVLAYALVEYPLPLTVEELGLFLRERATVEEVGRAVAALVGDGLLVSREEQLTPSPAALRYNEIEPIEPPGV